MPTYIEPLFRPPSEARSLIFQITIGCSHNNCRFCGMYKSKKFKIRPLNEIINEIFEIHDSYRFKIDRVFLADGDALIYPFDELSIILDTIKARMPSVTRISSYASPQSIMSKSSEQLVLLRSKLLKILYFGLESGDESTLKAVNKGSDAKIMADAALMVRNAGIKLSVTAVIGLAGREYSLQHAEATAKWVNIVNPEYFSLLTLFHRHNDDFISDLTLCNRLELLKEIHHLLTFLNPSRTILRSNHVSNFMNLAGSYPKDRIRLITEVEKAIHKASLFESYYCEVPDYREQY